MERYYPNPKSDLQDSEYLLYILNEKNIYISQTFIEKLLKTHGINYNIKNLSVFQRAMTHSSYIIRDFANDKLLKTIKEKNQDKIACPDLAIPLQNNSYERLEYLGDSVIHLILAEYLYNRYPDRDEGFLTKLRTKIENGKTLAYLAKQLDLHIYVLIARNIELMGGRENNMHIFEDTFEAFLGALYLDSNSDLNLCKKFVINIIETHIDMANLIHKEINHKDILLQYYHKMKWPDPEYKLKEVIERDGKKYFYMYVTYNNGGLVQVSGSGSGTSKKKAEQIAAYQALLKFDAIKSNESDDEFIYD
jgi:dsRNA-specific ribonuclease